MEEKEEEEEEEEKSWKDNLDISASSHQTFTIFFQMAITGLYW